MSDYQQINKIVQFAEKLMTSYGEIMDVYQKYQVYEPGSAKLQYLEEQIKNMQSFIDQNWEMIANFLEKQGGFYKQNGV